MTLALICQQFCIFSLNLSQPFRSQSLPPFLFASLSLMVLTSQEVCISSIQLSLSTTTYLSLCTEDGINNGIQWVAVVIPLLYFSIQCTLNLSCRISSSNSNDGPNSWEFLPLCSLCCTRITYITWSRPRNMSSIILEEDLLVTSYTMTATEESLM